MKRIKHIATYTIIAIAMLSACQENLEQRCQREAHTYTEKNCPALIAKDVTIDSLTFDKQSHTLCYAYTLGGVLDDSAIVNKSELKQQMLMDLRNATSLKIYKEAGYSFRYVYYSRKHQGQKLLDVVYKAKDYQK